MTTLNRFPTYNEPLTTKGATTRGWYTFWSGLFAGQPTGSVITVSVGPPPFTYSAPSGGTLIVQGGSTTLISFSRDGQNFIPAGVTAGPIPVAQGDQVVIAYSAAPPNVSFVPR